jgi:hypothetical protein
MKQCRRRFAIVYVICGDQIVACNDNNGKMLEIYQGVDFPEEELLPLAIPVRKYLRWGSVN